MFSSAERTRIRDRVLDLGRADARISGGAITGSHAINAEDSWSDVDTAFGYVPGTNPEEVLHDWTIALERELDVAHHFDLRQGETAYRVFLLSNALEIDVSLTPTDKFGAHGPTFRLVFGACTDGAPAGVESPDELIGWGWIYLLGARAAIERDRLWQGVRFIGAARDHGLGLACIRQGLPSRYARGVHRLDEDSTAPWRETLISSLEPTALRHALGVAVRAFLHEVARSDPVLADRLAQPLSSAGHLSFRHPGQSGGNRPVPGRMRASPNDEQ